jgi:G3E family GTPase
MLFGTIEGKSWDTDKPVNRLVFIGRDLDEGYIRNSLQKCLETVND